MEFGPLCSTPLCSLPWWISGGSGTPTTIGFIVDFDHVRAFTTDLDYARNFTVDVDYVRDFTIDIH